MADYYPLLAKAVAAAEPHEEARQAVFARARGALVTQLNDLDPPLSPAEIGRELRDLDDAIRRIEDDSAAEPTPAPDIEDYPAPQPLVAERRRIDQPALRRGGRPRPWGLLAVLSVIAAPVAVLAWMRRDAPAPIQSAQAPAPREIQAAGPDAQPKFAERIGGARAPGSPPSARPPSPATLPAQAGPSAQAGRPTASVPALPADRQVAVAQRAILIESSPSDPQQPQITVGRTLWRLDASSAAPGQPADTVVKADAEVPDAGIRLDLTLRRNLDAGLPASHILELSFTLAGDPPRVVRDVAPPEMRLDELTRGLQLKALPVPVKPNLFIVGLSDLKTDLDRNLELLSRRNWLEIPIRFASGQQAVLLLSKGVQGDRVLADAFRLWGQSPP